MDDEYKSLRLNGNVYLLLANHQGNHSSPASNESSNRLVLSYDAIIPLYGIHYEV